MGKRFHLDMGSYMENKSAARAAGMSCSRYSSKFKRLGCYLERWWKQTVEFFHKCVAYLRPRDDVDLSNLNSDVMVIKRKEHPLKTLMKQKVASRKKVVEAVDDSVDMSEVNRVMSEGSLR